MTKTEMDDLCNVLDTLLTDDKVTDDAPLQRLAKQFGITPGCLVGEHLPATRENNLRWFVGQYLGCQQVAVRAPSSMIPVLGMMRLLQFWEYRKEAFYAEDSPPN